jgi:hypothetical protein
MRIALEFKITAIVCKVLDEDIKTVYLEIGPNLNYSCTFRCAVEFGNMSLKLSFSHRNFRPC